MGALILIHINTTEPVDIIQGPATNVDREHQAELESMVLTAPGLHLIHPTDMVQDTAQDADQDETRLHVRSSTTELAHQQRQDTFGR